MSEAHPAPYPLGTGGSHTHKKIDFVLKKDMEWTAPALSA
jgi:hypothetical protein